MANPGELSKPARSDLERDYLALSLMDGSERYTEALSRLVPDAKTLADVYRVQTELFRRLCESDPTFARRDEARCRLDLAAVPQMHTRI